MFPTNINLIADILEQIGDGIIIIDSNLKIKYINIPLIKNLGYTKNQILEKSFDALYKDNNNNMIILNYLNEKRDFANQRYEGVLLKKDKTEFSIDFSLKSIINKKGEIEGLIIFVLDINHKTRIEEELRKNTMKDILTGLYNQNYFFEIFEKEVEIHKRYSKDLSLLYIDFDNFKICNDTHGHLFGDKILKYCSKIINNALRKSDTMFRYGGDEFIILIPESDLKDAVKLAKKIINNFNKKTEHLFKSIPNCQITISIGISELKDDESSEDFLKRADMAMYEAKKIKGFSYVVAD